MNVRVKICGITNLEDAMAAIEGGADALGFVFYDRSPRNVHYEVAWAIMEQLPPFVSRVGVFVNPPKALVRLALACGVDTVQFHGEEPAEFCASFGVKAIKAFRIGDATSLTHCMRYPTMPWLLDSCVPGQQGGSGTVFNWELAAAIRDENPHIILAGGLTARNVGQAIKKVKPYAVDVSSGVESAPGKKDFRKIQAFIKAVRRAAE